MIPYENAPITSFHRRLVVSAGSGQFSNGFSIGIIAVVLSLAKEPLGLTVWWMGAVGASPLIGLFFGSLVAGAISDRFGRRPVFRWGMLLFTTFAVLQYFSSSAYELFAIRFLLGVTLGADYVACKAIITEYSPSRNRGQFLSILALSWTAGYVSAYLAGYIVRVGGPEAWRTALLASAVPPFVAFLLRFRTPESPYWLARVGQLEKAREIITKHIRPDVALPAVSRIGVVVSEKMSGHTLVQHLFVGCVFYSSQVIPVFALGTFLPIVMVKLGIRDGYLGALFYNFLFMLGAVIGPFVIDRIARRTLLIHGFVVMAILLAILISWRTAPPLITVTLFAAFAFVLSVAGILQFVYPPELFDTTLRARGIGAITAISRLGSACGTFYLPIVIDQYGIYTALGFCMAVMIFAAAVCYKWAPETLRMKLV